MRSRTLALVRPAGAEPVHRFTRAQMPRLEDEFFRPVVAVLTMRRQLIGLSQAELNFRVGCPDNHLAKWEAGMHRPSLYFLLLWCEALGYRLTLRDVIP